MGSRLLVAKVGAGSSIVLGCEGELLVFGKVKPHDVDMGRAPVARGAGSGAARIWLANFGLLSAHIRAGLKRGNALKAVCRSASPSKSLGFALYFAILAISSGA
jgi:hypothetical protein